MVEMIPVCWTNGNGIVTLGPLAMRTANILSWKSSGRSGLHWQAAVVGVGWMLHIPPHSHLVEVVDGCNYGHRTIFRAAPGLPADPLFPVVWLSGWLDCWKQMTEDAACGIPRPGVRQHLYNASGKLFGCGLYRQPSSSKHEVGLCTHTRWQTDKQL